MIVGVEPKIIENDDQRVNFVEVFDQLGFIPKPELQMANKDENKKHHQALQA